MTKREEIREGFTEIIRTNLSGQGLIDSNLYDGFCAVLEDAVLQGFHYLHDNCVVLRVDGELPDVWEPLIKES